jgi:serine/threonine protein kinase
MYAFIRNHSSVYFYLPRDLKPENILIKDGIFKICDFGFSKKINNMRLKNQTVVGTPLYMSIQILKSEYYTSKCDIWALGFIFYEVQIILFRCYTIKHHGSGTHNSN